MVEDFVVELIEAIKVKCGLKESDIHTNHILLADWISKISFVPEKILKIHTELLEDLIYHAIF